uniref:Hemolysin-type calcium-binding region n=1 Tax=Caulobacter sp. (strain K31) TaxID=366602 RepID=B0SWB4_CAUSK
MAVARAQRRIWKVPAMSIIILNDPTYGVVLFGDTQDELIASQVGLSQTLAETYTVDEHGDSIPLDYQVGDASGIRGNALGGDDHITSYGSAVGDAFTLAEHGRGGMDTIFAHSGHGSAFGDALTMTGHASGGDDLITIFNDSFGGWDGSMFGDAKLMTDDARGGNDTLKGLSDHLSDEVVLYGDALEMNGRAQGGDDILAGDMWTSNYQYGDAQTLSEQARGGNDRLFGGDYSWTELNGDAYLLTDNAVGGNDLITGGSAYDVSEGANDMLGDGYQLAGHAIAGDDVLIGGRGDSNTMWGDGVLIGPDVTRGHNRFVISPSGEIDTLKDFNPGHDQIVLAGFTYTAFADIAGAIHPTDTGVQIDLGADGLVIVEGVTQLTAADVTFDANARKVAGGSHNDVLTAAGGNNAFHGGLGDDTFIIQAVGLANSVGGSTQGVGADSVIWDFAGAGGTPAGANDLLQLQGFGPGSTLTFLRFGGLRAGGPDPTLQYYSVHDTMGGPNHVLFVHSLNGQLLTSADYGFI